MGTLLVVAIILTTLAIVIQAGVLVSMYLLSRRLTNKADLVMNDSRRVIAPFESITADLKTAANTVAETSKTAQATVMRPLREYSAIALAIAEGARTFFKNRKTEPEPSIKEKHPAA
jgi:hypothetical protein